MKHFKNLLACLIAFTTLGLSAQAPEGVNYQAVARDGSGNVLANENLTVRMTIKEGGPAGTTVFQETHNTTTNDFGLFDLIIGQGSVVTGTFSNLNWGSSSHFLQVEVDDGGGYVNLGTSQFVSVPYALYAKSAGGGGGSYTAGTGIDISGNVISNTGDTDASDDITTSSNAGGDASGTFSNLTVVGLQGRSVSSAAPTSGEVLKWNGSAWAPANDVGGGSGDNWGTQVVQTDATLSGNGVSGNELGIAQQGASSGQVLKWNGSAWVPDTDNSGGSYSAGTGISISGNIITNTAPDQTVQIKDGGATTVSGSYPNFTITSTDNNTTYSAGTGLDLTGTTFSNTGDTDASDDITTSSLAGGDLKGTYPDPSVIKLQGNQMNAQNPNDGDVLQWDMSTSRWINVPMESSPWMTNGSDIYYDNGQVGIGASTASANLHITASGNNISDLVRFTSATNGNEDWYLYMNGNDDLVFRNDGTNILNLNNSNSNVGIGTDNPDSKLHVIGDSMNFEIRNENNGFKIIPPVVSDPVLIGYGGFSENGYIGTTDMPMYNIYSFRFYASASTSYLSYSDNEIKENISNLTDPIDKIKSLQAVRYDLKKDFYNKRNKVSHDPAGRLNHIGFIAQDVEKIFPELVKTDQDTGLKSVGYIGLIPVLVEGMKSQQHQIDQLIKENNELKSRLERLEAR